MSLLPSFPTTNPTYGLLLWLSGNEDVGGVHGSLNWQEPPLFYLRKEDRRRPPVADDDAAALLLLLRCVRAFLPLHFAEYNFFSAGGADPGTGMKTG